MQRLSIEARKDWLPQLTSEGVLWTTTEEGPYWTEALKQPKYYSFTRFEQEQLEHAANEIHEMCLETMEWLIEQATAEQRFEIFEMFNIPEEARSEIVRSWQDDEWGYVWSFRLHHDQTWSKAAGIQRRYTDNFDRICNFSMELV